MAYQVSTIQNGDERLKIEWDSLIQDVLFGSFTQKETSDLCTVETADLEFGWLKKTSTRGKGSGATPSGSRTNHSLSVPPSSSVNNDLGRRSFSPSILSPNIPPNPPTSPVDGATTNRHNRPAAQKLNVNAVPFVPALGSGIGEPVIGLSVNQGSSKNSFKTVRKLDFESAADPAKAADSVKADDGGEEGGILWDRIECPIPPRLQPCGSIQTSGQATSESRTTTVTDATRESGQFQCRSQDDQACESVGVVSSTSPSVEPCVSAGVAGLSISPPPPLQLPPAGLRSPEVPDPLLVVSTSLSGQSQTDSWPSIPSSPPPPIPLPPSHYHKTQRGEDVQTSVISSPPLSSLAGSSHSFTNSNSIGDNMPLGQTKSSSSQHQSSIASVSSSCGTGDGNGITTGPPFIPHTSIDSTSVPSVPISSFPNSVATTADNTPSAVSTPAPAVTPPSDVATETSVSTASTGEVLPSVTPTSGGGAWGSNRVKSWASIFKESSAPGSRPASCGKGNPKPLATPTSGDMAATMSQDKSLADTTSTTGGVAIGRSGRPCGVQLLHLSEQLQSWSVCHKYRHLQTRGLVNSGNWCYVHAPLQALLSVPSLVHLFKALNPNPPLARGPSATPFSDAVCRFVHEFRDSPKSTVPTTSSTSSSGSQKKKKLHHRMDLVPGDPFQPKYVYDVLQKNRLNLSYKGRQEDAEEFLGCLLDGLHEEMVAANRLVGRGQEEEEEEGKDMANTPECEGHTSPSSCSGSTATSVTGDLHQERSSSDIAEGEEWEQVGPKNKSTITRQTSFSESPITEIFGGQFRSVLYRQGARESATMEPFFSLQLDIQGEGTTSVKEAMEALATKETVHLSEVDAYKRLTLARLPPVLVLHLKRFVFNSSGSQKLFKFISYDRDMEIAKELLAPVIKTKLTSNQRSYKLWAVVYHHGKTATGGHYTCDAYHSASGGWVRMDDALVKSIPEDFVLTPGGGVPNKTAYLLFYRRKDTIM